MQQFRLQQHAEKFAYKEADIFQVQATLELPYLSQRLLSRGGAFLNGCNETIPNFWNGAQYDPNPQDKTYTRVNETECKVDKPTCSQANKTITKAAAEDACEDACNGRDVVWNDDICAWECAKADVCDADKRNCLEQNPPECGNNMNGQNTKSGGDKTLNQQTCEWEDCECIDLDNNNDDHKCFDKDQKYFTGSGIESGSTDIKP